MNTKMPPKGWRKHKTKVQLEERASPNRLTIEPGVLDKLLEAKSIRQISWKDCVVLYAELTGEIIDYRTLRDHINESLNGHSLALASAKGAKELVKTAYEDANIVVYIMSLIVARFTEFSIYNRRHLAWIVNQTPDEDEPYPVKPLSPVEMERMETIYQDIMTFWWRCQDALRISQASAQGMNAVMGVIQTVVTGEPSAVALESGLVPTAAALPALSPKSAQAALDTYQMLEELNERHRAEGVGYHRPMLEESDDLEEGDEDDDASI